MPQIQLNDPARALRTIGEDILPRVQRKLLAAEWALTIGQRVTAIRLLEEAQALLVIYSQRTVTGRDGCLRPAPGRWA